MHSKRIKEKVKQDYDEIAKNFHSTRLNAWKEFDLFAPYIPEGLRTLDLGCGNGRLLKHLKAFSVREYLGVDQSKELISIAKKSHQDSFADFAVFDMSDPAELKGLESSHFDVIFMIASFQHLPPVDQLRTLKLCRESLKDGGHLIMLNWNLNQRRFLRHWLKHIFCLEFLRYGWRGLLIPWQDKVKRYYYSFTRRRLKRLIRLSGFKLVENRFVSGSKPASIFSGRNILTIAKK
jgi:SAM-dependent methyltransferase